VRRVLAANQKFHKSQPLVRKKKGRRKLLQAGKGKGKVVQVGTPFVREEGQKQYGGGASFFSGCCEKKGNISPL